MKNFYFILVFLLTVLISSCGDYRKKDQQERPTGTQIEPKPVIDENYHKAQTDYCHITKIVNQLSVKCNKKILRFNFSNNKYYLTSGPEPAPKNWIYIKRISDFRVQIDLENASNHQDMEVKISHPYYDLTSFKISQGKITDLKTKNDRGETLDVILSQDVERKTKDLISKGNYRKFTISYNDLRSGSFDKNEWSFLGFSDRPKEIKLKNNILYNPKDEILTILEDYDITIKARNVLEVGEKNYYLKIKLDEFFIQAYDRLISLHLYFRSKKTNEYKICNFLVLVPGISSMEKNWGFRY